MKNTNKSNPHNLQVGQVVYRVSVRWGESMSIEECLIKSIGRKYFEIDNGQYGECRIRLDTLCYTNEHHPMSNYKVYLDKQEILDLIEFNRLYLKIQAKFTGFVGTKYGLSLSKLREIVKILDAGS